MNRQYIGARYVPKFFENPNGSNDWIEGIAYEPLTVVTYLNNSFTSKKPVPVGINILNTEYWVNTGNYNAQVAEYQQQVVNLSQSLTNEINNRENNDIALQNDISNINTKIPYSQIVSVQGALLLPADRITYLQHFIGVNPNSALIFKTEFINTSSDLTEMGIGFGYSNDIQYVGGLIDFTKIENVNINTRANNTFIFINANGTETINLYLYGYSKNETTISQIATEVIILPNSYKK